MTAGVTNATRAIEYAVGCRRPCEIPALHVAFADVPDGVENFRGISAIRPDVVQRTERLEVESLIVEVAWIAGPPGKHAEECGQAAGQGRPMRRHAAAASARVRLDRESTAER